MVGVVCDVPTLRIRPGCAQHRGMASNVKHQVVKGSDGKIVTNLPGVPDAAVSASRVSALDTAEDDTAKDDTVNDDEVETCRGCSADLADDEGEGYDGFCGSCADNVQELLATPEMQALRTFIATRWCDDMWTREKCADELEHEGLPKVVVEWVLG